jgi:hypothetical protein
MACDKATANLLDLIVDDHIHASDRAEIERIILAVALEYDGHINPNIVRDRLPDWVQPQLVGPTYRSLYLAGDIDADGWTVSTDLRGRNSGKPSRCYRLRPPTEDAQ